MENTRLTLYTARAPSEQIDPSASSNLCVKHGLGVHTASLAAMLDQWALLMVYLPPAQLICTKVWVAFADELAFAGRCAMLYYHHWTFQERCLTLDHLFEPFFCNSAQAGL